MNDWFERSSQEYALKPKIIFPYDAGKALAPSNDCDGGCDGDCACALPSSHFASANAAWQIPTGWNTVNLVHSAQVQILPLVQGTWVIAAPGTLVGWAVMN